MTITIEQVNGALHVVEGDVSGHNRLHSRALGVNVGDEVLIINVKQAKMVESFKAKPLLTYADQRQYDSWIERG